MEELFPHLKSGELPTAAKLTYKLRSFRGRVAGDRILEPGPKTNSGIVWVVRQVEEPED